MAFFADRPVPPAEPEPPQPRTPAWLQPPGDEIPVAVHMGRRLSSRRGVALHLVRLDVHREGVRIRVQLDVREEPGLDDAALHAVDGYLGGRRPMSSFDGLLRFGVTLADGSSADTSQPTDWTLVGDPGAPPPAAPRLALTGGGGSGDGRQWTQRIDLWLWPLPPAGAWTLHHVADELGIGEASTVIDVDAQQLAAGAISVWDEPERT